MEEKLQDLMQAYLDGTLQEPELSDFKLQLQNNSELEAEVAHLREIQTSMHALGAESLLEATQDWEREINEKKKNGNVRSLSIKRVLSIAAGVAAVTAIIFFLRKPDYTTTELFASYYEPYENLIISRGEGDDIILKRAMDAYDNHNYQRAVSLLQPYLEANPNERSAALYLGIAQMELSNYGEAESQLMEALNDPLYQQQADWYLALLYLRMDDVSKLSKTLEKIITMGDHYKEKEAREILGSL